MVTLIYYFIGYNKKKYVFIDYIYRSNFYIFV